MALTQVKSDGIATGAVTATQIATGAVTANDLEDSGVTAGTYGSSSAIPAITVDAKGRVTSATTNSVTQVGGANGVDFNDNVSVRFGTGNDFSIVHTGSDTILTDSGTGDVYLRNDTNVFIQNAAGTETKAAFTSNGAATFYHDSSQKLATSSTGINVTGTVNCDGVTCDGQMVAQSTAEYQLVVKDTNSTGTAAETGIAFRDSANTVQGRIGHIASGNNILYVFNELSDEVRFGTNGTGRCRVQSDGHFTPMDNNTYDIGTSSLRWRNVYTNDLNLSNEGGTNDVDGTWGSWTIQEGEDDLFLLNRRNGKKYKFNLSEVN